MVCPTNLPRLQTGFNPAIPDIMYIDLNSCFASVEQQANPLLRNKPIAVVHTDAPYGCILAPSIEAKLWGVKTGMTLAEGGRRCPVLVVREADPPKYREVHRQIGELLSEYSPRVVSKSIDEFVIQGLNPRHDQLQGFNPCIIAEAIKSRIKSEIGDYLRVSIGISTNQILAKLASGLHKPDGLDIIDSSNFSQVYQSINLQDFCGINVRNEARLHRLGIFTALQFYQASPQMLKSAFQSILGQYWYVHLRGYPVGTALAVARDSPIKSFGQSYVLPRPMAYDEWRPILAKLVSKAARRLRRAGYCARGVHLALRLSDHADWHTGHQGKTLIFDDASLLALALSLYHRSAPQQLVKKLAVTCFGLKKDHGQLSCLTDTVKQKNLVSSLDTLNDKWGEFSVTYGAMMGSSGHVHGSIAFGK